VYVLYRVREAQIGHRLSTDGIGICADDGGGGLCRMMGKIGGDSQELESVFRDGRLLLFLCYMDVAKMVDACNISTGN